MWWPNCHIEFLLSPPFELWCIPRVILIFWKLYFHTTGSSSLDNIWTAALQVMLSTPVVGCPQAPTVLPLVAIACYFVFLWMQFWVDEIRRAIPRFKLKLWRITYCIIQFLEFLLLLSFSMKICLHDIIVYMHDILTILYLSVPDSSQ